MAEACSSRCTHQLLLVSVILIIGGIYTDIDNGPTPAFLDGEAIADNDEAWFPIEQLGVLSQFFMASSPRHPLMWLLVQHTIHRLLSLPDVDSQYVPSITGPGALKVAFMDYNGVSPHGRMSRHRDPGVSFQRVTSGRYHGWNNSTVTVVGDKEQSNQYVRRSAVRNKQQLYQQMGMVHFDQARGPSRNESCVYRVYHDGVLPLSKPSNTS